MKYLRVILFVLLLGVLVTPLVHAPLAVQLFFAVLFLAAVFVPARKLPWYLQLNGGVTVSLSNGNLGGTVVTNRVVGMVLTGVTEMGGYTLGTAIKVTSMNDVATAGITQTNNPFAYQKINDFYLEAPVGTPLYLLLVASTMTIANICDQTNANGHIKLYNYAGGAIRYMICCADDKAVHTGGGTITITNGMNADVYTAATNLAASVASARTAQKPFRGIIGGSSYAGTASALTDFSSGSNNSTIIMIGDDQNWDGTYSSAAVGLLGGRIASNAVQVKASRVKDGALNITEVYLHTTTIETAGGDPATIAGKNYVTFKTYPNLQGYFFSGDPMLTASTDDYNCMARCAVIDEAQVIAYTTFVQEVDDDIPTVTGGLPDPAWCKWMEQQIINQITEIMVSVGACSAVDCFIDPTQNIVSTNTLNGVLKIRPKGYLTFININLGYEL